LLLCAAIKVLFFAAFISAAFAVKTPVYMTDTEDIYEIF